MKTQHLTDFNMYVDGDSFIGVCKKVTLPSLKFQKKEKALSGSACAGDVMTGRVEKLEVEMDIETLLKNKLFRALGNSEETPIVIKGSIAEGGQHKALEVELSGTFHEMNLSDLEADSGINMNIKGTLCLYKMTCDGDELIYVNANKWIVRVAGEDKTAQLRTNLGL